MFYSVVANQRGALIYVRGFTASVPPRLTIIYRYTFSRDRRGGRVTHALLALDI